jgi:hypothetical protein
MKGASLPVLVAGWLGIGIAYGQQPSPTNEDVDRAIRVCSLGSKIDTQIEGGISLLKNRILSGGGEYSHSEIPSVIGGGVQTDTAKIDIFDRMQKCVVDHVYPPHSQSNGTGTLIPGHETSPPSRCPIIPDAVTVYFGNIAGSIATKFPHTVIAIKNKNMLTINRNDSNEISVNLYVYGSDGRYIVKFINNNFELNPDNKWTKEDTSDRNSLIVKDEHETKVLDIRYLNEAAVRITGIFRYGEAAISVEENGIKIDNPPIRGATISGFCSVEAGGADIHL